MMQEFEFETLEHEQTGKLHIISINLGPLQHCYCSFDRHRDELESETVELDIDDEQLCETCVQGFIEDEETDVSPDEFLGVMKA